MKMSSKVLLYVYLFLSTLNFCALARGALSPFNPATDATIMFYLEQIKDKFYCSANRTTILEEQLAQVIITSKHYINHVLYGNLKIPSVELFNRRNPHYLKFKFNLNQADKSGRRRYTLLIQKNMKKYELFTEYNKNTYTAVYCDVNIHVRQNKTPLTIAINDVELTTVRTNLSVIDYDAVAYYKFREGELADISCGEREQFGNLTLRYHDMKINAYNSKQLQHISKYTLTAQVKLKSEHVDNYLTCHIQNNNGKDYASVRIYFLYESDPEDDIFTIRINGLKLRKNSNIKKQKTEEFSYNVKEKETLEVVCGTKRGSKETLKFHNKQSTVTYEYEDEHSIKMQINSDDPSFDSTLLCQYNNTDDTAHSVAIIHLNLESHDVYILGIPPNNIQYQYTNSVENVIMYEYSDGEVLKLVCMGKAMKPVQFLYSNYNGRDTVKSSDTPIANVRRINQTLVLNSGTNNSTLKCWVKKEPNEIKFTISVRLMMINSQKLTSIDSSSHDKELTTTPEVANEDNQSNNDWMMVGIGSGLCVLLMILSLILCSIHERQQKERRKRFSGINYQNLPNNPDYTLPYPSQWNEEYYAETSALGAVADTYTMPDNQNNIGDLYAKPVPKRLRNKPKEKETINYVNIVPTYSDVDKREAKVFNDPKYAQVVPKNLRNTMKPDEMNDYANMTTTQNYAEVVPKNQRKNNKQIDKQCKSLQKVGYPKIAPKPDHSNASNYSNIDKPASNTSTILVKYSNIDKKPYAEVVHGIKNRNNYKNVCPNNETYANINSNSDYAEPAYCELNIKS